MSNLRSYCLAVTLIFQCLLFFRIAVPAIHSLAHGDNEPIACTSSESALCIISQAESQTKSTSKAISVIAFSVDYMFPAPALTYSFFLPGDVVAILLPQNSDKPLSSYLALTTPPPQN